MANAHLASVERGFASVHNASNGGFDESRLHVMGSSMTYKRKGEEQTLTLRRPYKVSLVSTALESSSIWFVSGGDSMTNSVELSKITNYTDRCHSAE